MYIGLAALLYPIYLDQYDIYGIEVSCGNALRWIHTPRCCMRKRWRWLCDVSQTDNAVMVFNTLEQYFRPDRIKYFVTSAIGFFVDPRKGAYDPDDIQNLLPGPENAPKRLRIRGTVHPINVMEPVLWLGRQLAGVPDE